MNAKIKLALIAMLMTVCLPPAMAMSASRSNNTLREIPYTYLGTLVSTGATTMSDFVLGVSPYLHGYATKTNTESCGEIASNAAHDYALVWGTNHSHLGCIIPAGNVPVGFAPVGITIHAHPVRAGFHMTRADVILGQFGRVGRYVGLFVDTPSHFSATDYAGGPGYLATPAGAIFQDGSANTVRVITGTPCAVKLEHRQSHYLASL